MEDKNFDSSRREVIKGIGAAGAASAFGFGSIRVNAKEVDVSKSQVKDIVEQKETQVALKKAGVNSLKQDEATGQKINQALWIEVPADGAEIFAYNTEDSTVEIKTSSGTVVRAKPEDDGMFVEELETGETVTAETLQSLQRAADWQAALKNGSVTTVNTADATAHFDRESGISRAFVPAELENGDDVMLLTELSSDGSLKTVYALPLGTDGVTAQESAIDCWADCISFGVVCSSVCTPCVSAPTIPTCAPCGVCIGGTATLCAGKCGIEQFW